MVGVIDCATHISDGVDVDVVLGLLRMGHKGFNEKLPQETGDRLNFLLLARSGCDPGFGLRPGLVEGEETALASSLDQLIWLGHQLQSRLQQPWECSLCLVEDAIDVVALWKVE